MEFKDLEVIVLTYNRADYLKIMLESLCNQTATGFVIKVLNNASTDNTVNVVNDIIKKYPERNIILITNEKNLGNPGNFKKSQEIAEDKYKYTAVFHDDDAIHPEYINTAMQLFYKHPQAVICSANLEPLCVVSNHNWAPLDKNYHIYSSKDGIYLHMLVNRPSFASDIYKTDCYKKIKYYPEKYGKLHDIIFMFESNCIGDMIYIQGNAIRYRIAPTCDSNNFENGPFPQEVIAVIKRISELNQNHKFFGGYLLNSFAQMLYDWSYLDKYITYDEFCSRLVKEGVFSKFEHSLYSNKITRFFFKTCIKFRKKHYRHIIKNKYGKRI